MIVRTKPWRRRLAGYLHENDLPPAGKGHGEAGWSTETNRPFGKPARHVIKRVSNHLEARHVITHEQNDGTLNSHIQAALNPPLTPGERAVAYGHTQVGVHESPWGSNRGADVVRYQTSTGAFGLPWCASFVWYCWEKAGYKGTTSAGAWYSTDNLGTRQTLASARVGDLVSLNEGSGHVGMLLRKNGNSVTLLAGNTSNSVQERDYSNDIVHSICRPHV